MPHRVRRGCYCLAEPDSGVVLDEQILAALFPEAAVCVHSALFRYGYSDSRRQPQEKNSSHELFPRFSSAFSRCSCSASWRESSASFFICAASSR